MRKSTVLDLFTPAEHAVLSAWMKMQPPPEALGIDPDKALDELGCSEFIPHPVFDAAAVAYILGEKALSPRRLFAIDWALGSVFSWPQEYNLIWVPGYDRFVVTVSADSDMYGSPHVALGSFEENRPKIEAVGEIVTRRWAQHADYGLGRWQMFVGEGLIDQPTVEAWADQVWPDQHDEQIRSDASSAMKLRFPEYSSAIKEQPPRREQPQLKVIKGPRAAMGPLERAAHTHLNQETYREELKRKYPDLSEEDLDEAESWY